MKNKEFYYQAARLGWKFPMDSSVWKIWTGVLILLTPISIISLLYYLIVLYQLSIELIIFFIILYIIFLSIFVLLLWSSYNKINFYVYKNIESDYSIYCSRIIETLKNFNIVYEKMDSSEYMSRGRNLKIRNNLKKNPRYNKIIILDLIELQLFITLASNNEKEKKCTISIGPVERLTEALLSFYSEKIINHRFSREVKIR